jgi:hypothetical protein
MTADSGHMPKPVSAKRVTISDVAAALGLAKGTVSRALNGYPDIAEATRLRVSKQAARMGYRPMAQAQAIRTKAHALMFVTLHRDSSNSRPAMADYLLLFRKPGENAVPVKPDVDNETWIQWARPIWTGIKETNTLNTHVAKDSNDERHICPLQLDLIARCVRLWSNEGETVLSPFGGIGSEGFEAVRLGRKFVGCELKASYWKAAVANLERAEHEASLPSLLDGVPA